MTFFIKRDEVHAKAVLFPQLPLSQRARASMDILGSVQHCAAGPLRSDWRERFETHPETVALAAESTEGKTAPELKARIAQGRAIAEQDKMFHLERFLQRYVAEMNFVAAIPAVEERRAQFERLLDKPDTNVGGTLDLTEDFDRPPYANGSVEWHLEPGGWDGYDLAPSMFGYAIGRVFARGGYGYTMVDEDIRQHRAMFVAQFPKDKYRRIVELGCGACTTLFTAARRYPDAELAGYDTSPTLLTMGHTAAEIQGVRIDLKMANAEHVAEADDSVSLVYTYALHHEIPPKTSYNVLKEAFRILEPGGDFIMSDLPPHRAVDPYHSILLDWETKHRGEPFFTASGLMDLDAAMREIGFVDVESFGLTASQYPWVTRGRKPG